MGKKIPDLQFLKDVSPAVAAFYQQNKNQLPQILQKYSITEIPQIINFLSQCAHESSNFKKTQESMFYTSVNQIKKTFPTACKGKTDAEIQQLVSKKSSGNNPAVDNSQKLGNFVYKNGYKYRGRGYLQLTGKSNYEQFGQHIGLKDQILKNPDLVSKKYSLQSAGYFFQKNGCNQLSKKLDPKSIDATTKIINGKAMKGLQDRKKYYIQFQNKYQKYNQKNPNQQNGKNKTPENKLSKNNFGPHNIQIQNSKEIKKTINQMFNKLNKQNIFNFNKNLNGQGKLDLGGVDLKYDLQNKRFDGFQMTEDLVWLHTDLKKNNNDRLANDMKLKDLVVPLKIMFDSKITTKNISVSLDPLIPTQPDGPNYKKIYYPKQLDGTEFGQIMIEADHLMKQLKMGVDKQNKPFKYPQSLKKVGLSFDQISKFVQFTGEIQRTRQWIIIKDVQIIHVDKNVFKVGKITMGLLAKIQKISSQGKLIDSDEKLHKDTQIFCNLFTEHYELLCKQFPIFEKLKSMAKASIIARQMYLSGCQIDLQLINSLYQYQKTDKSSRIIKKLSVTYEKKKLKRKIIVEGGCDLTTNKLIQQKIQQKLFDKHPQNNQIVSQKFEYDKESYFPFLFQKIKKCSQDNCQLFCPQNYYALEESKCKNHSSKKCFNCSEFMRHGQNCILINQFYVHLECMICSFCGEKIQNQYSLTEKQILVHPGCMPKKVIEICEKCQSPIYYEEKYFKENQKYYHPDCFPKQKCFICNKSLEDKYKIINDKKMHAQCFICNFCKKPILQQQFVMTKNDEAIHLKCRVLQKCEQCQKNIQNICKIVNGKKYHKQCLKCTSCNKEIGDKKFGMRSDGKFVHVSC